MFLILHRHLLRPSNIPISHGSQLVASEKSLPKLDDGVLFRLPKECTFYRLGVLLDAALAQLGLLSEPQQICGEETRYRP